MRITLLLLAALLLATPPATARAKNPRAAKIPVLVVDSGTDFSHSLIQPRGLANPAELAGKPDVDDDGNGFADDLYGWNFVEDLGRLVNLATTPPQYDRVLRTMELLGRFQAFGKENLSAAEFEELKANYNDKEIMAWVQFTGGWAHGTHVAGIVATDAPQVLLKGITHIPAGQAPMMADLQQSLAPLALHLRAARKDGGAGAPRETPSMEEFAAYFEQQGQAAAARVERQAKYMGSLAPRVINCSFGTDNKKLLATFQKNMVESWGFQDPTPAQVQELVNLFVTKAQLPRDRALFAHVKDALVVIAAGNSSEDNDPLVISPNNMGGGNTLIVAATNQDKEMAKFTCYGGKSVDVAVPGVFIHASYPNGKTGYMSGTSMAAPLASRYAAMVLSENPALPPAQLKKILMGTVDKKAWLEGKVVSGGVINVARAMAAARSMKAGLALDDALRAARAGVEDRIKSGPFDLFTPVTLRDEFERDLYFSAVF